LLMAPSWKVTPPKSDADYLDRMMKVIFTAGLKWTVVDKKWPNFRKAFAGFEPARVARLSEADFKTLMNDAGIVRNEKKIRATIQNAKAVLTLKKEYGSMKQYVDSFGREEGRLQKDLQVKFEHMGPSSARMFLWSIGYPLKPTKEEKAWMAANSE